jgi:hypothetical protein
MAQISENAELKNEVDTLAERMGRLQGRIREATTTAELREVINLYWWELVQGVDRVEKLSRPVIRGPVAGTGA